MSIGRLQDLDDRALVVAAQEEPGGTAFRLVYERHSPKVYRFLVKLVGDRDLAEDVTQETFFQLYETLDRYDPARSFGPWLFRIARNRGLNALRARKKKAPTEGPERSESGRVAAAVASKEATDVTGQALADLPDEARALLLQRHALGMTQAELAESWSCTDRTIRNRLHAADLSTTDAQELKPILEDTLPPATDVKDCSVTYLPDKNAFVVTAPKPTLVAIGRLIDKVDRATPPPLPYDGLPSKR